jgi:hypothetical protein
MIGLVIDAACFLAALVLLRRPRPPTLMAR